MPENAEGRGKRDVSLPCYELFFHPLALTLDPTAYERIQFAYFASKFGHAMQKREGGARFFDHPKAAAWIYINELGGRDARAIIVLLLHDLSEDSYLLSPYRINLNLGAEIALDVRAVTKLPKGKETIEEYFGRIIARGPWAILAKLCDRLHNLRTLDACDATKQWRQIAETRDILLPMLISALRAHGGEGARCADILEVKIKEAMALYEK